MRANKPIITEEGISLLLTLNTAAMRVFLWVSLNFEYNRDFVLLRREKMCDECGIGRAASYKAVSELEKSGVLRKYVRGVYWVNPGFIWRTGPGNKATCGWFTNEQNTL